MIVTATIPESIQNIAKVALATGTDMLDILIRSDVVDKLAKYKEILVKSNTTFITQAGFHPGLVSPIIRYAKAKFDRYETANVAISMGAVFEQPKAIREIMHKVIAGKSEVLEKGFWRKANYKDAIAVNFSSIMGVKKCFPIQMKELYGLETELGLQNAGVYVAGFSSFIDNYIFPLAVIGGFINKRLSEKFCSWLMFKSIKSDAIPYLKFMLDAKGMKHGKEIAYHVEINANNSFDFTAKAVIACLKQYENNRVNTSGLH
ncbi:MAG: hypothetical protein AAGI07_08415, partial [Bacteroidota bacterium]